MLDWIRAVIERLRARRQERRDREGHQRWLEEQRRSRCDRQGWS